MSGLEGKVALVTGADGMRGIGRATALKLAELGVDLAITDVHRDAEDLPPAEIRMEWKSVDSVAEEVRRLGRECLPLYADLTDSAQIQDVVRQTVDHFGRLDIMVNNARAIIGKDRVPVTELDEDIWRQVLDINTTATFLFTKLAGREMVRSGKRRTHYQHGFQRRQTGWSSAIGLLRLQVCGVGADPGVGTGPGLLPNYCKRGVPLSHQHRPHRLRRAGYGPSRGYISGGAEGQSSNRDRPAGPTGAYGLTRGRGQPGGLSGLR
jgi:NAD(P)-dependent dehydrogenase (short-subunit alcohol dehydrogenase family)